MAAQQETRSAIPRAVAALLILFVLPYQAAARVLSFRASIPFQFVVGRETLPAATYIVEVLLGQLQAGDAIGVVVLKTPDGRIYRAAFTTVASGCGRTNSPHSSLVFDERRGKHYLTLLTMASEGVELGISNRVPPDATASRSRQVPMEELR